VVAKRPNARKGGHGLLWAAVLGKAAQGFETGRKMSGFDMVIWAGAALTMAGVVGLVACVVWVVRLRRSGASDEAMRKGMQRVVLYNMGALFASTIGLMMVVLGILLK